jgi:protein-disulfide isomerase
VILIDIWEGSDPRPEVERFCEMWGIKGTILLDETAQYARSLGVRGVPTNILVDADGIVRNVGLVKIDELHAAVDSLLAD